MLPVQTWHEREQEAEAIELGDQARADGIGDGEVHIADFSYLLIRKDGTEPPDLPRFFLTAGHGSEYEGINFYRHMVDHKKPVVVIGGPFKIPALRAGLRGKLFWVLITDQHSAEQLAKGS